MTDRLGFWHVVIPWKRERESKREDLWQIGNGDERYKDLREREIKEPLHAIERVNRERLIVLLDIHI